MASRGSHAHEALKDVVLNKRLLKDIGKLNLFCHTGGLEVYHSVMTKFCPKREHFPYKGMLARTHLAALEHNHNVNRIHATTTTGEKRYKLEHRKAKKEWIVRPIYESMSNSHLNDMMKEVIEKRNSDRRPLQKVSAARQYF